MNCSCRVGAPYRISYPLMKRDDDREPEALTTCDCFAVRSNEWVPAPGLNLAAWSQAPACRTLGRTDESGSLLTALCSLQHAPIITRTVVLANM